jgi:hypothetical protein
MTQQIDSTQQPEVELPSLLKRFKIALGLEALTLFISRDRVVTAEAMVQLPASP